MNDYAGGDANGNTKHKHCVQTIPILCVVVMLMLMSILGGVLTDIVSDALRLWGCLLIVPKRLRSIIFCGIPKMSRAKWKQIELMVSRGRGGCDEVGYLVVLTIIHFLIIVVKIQAEFQLSF